MNVGDKRYSHHLSQTRQSDIIKTNQSLQDPNCKLCSNLSDKPLETVAEIKDELMDDIPASPVNITDALY